MLETIRQYARDRLIASGESTELRARHLARFRRIALDAGPALDGAGMLAALEQLDVEIDNIRAAADWAFETEPEAGIEIAVALGQVLARPVGGAPRAWTGSWRPSTPSAGCPSLRPTRPPSGGASPSASWQRPHAKAR